MNMKTTLLSTLLALLIGFTGCSTMSGIFGKNSNKEAKQSDRIEQIVQSQSVNQQESVNQISSLAYGIDFSLGKITNNIPQEVEIAKGLNHRILTLSGMPSVDEIRLMEETINNLRTNVAYGQRLLSKRDSIISSLQEDNLELKKQKDLETKKYQELAQMTARKADTTKAVLDEYRGWFGLKAVLLGMKQFFLTSLYVIVGVLIVFAIIRGFASTNPIASAILGILEQIVSWFINGIKYLFPKAISLAGHIPKIEFDGYKQTLIHLIDSIQLVKEKNPNATLKEALEEVSKSMDVSDKERVDQIKKSLNWK